MLTHIIHLPSPMYFISYIPISYHFLQALVDKVTATANIIVQVDSFDRIGSELQEDASFVRPGLRNTKFAHLDVGIAHASTVPLAVAV